MTLQHKRRMTLAGIFIAAAFFIWMGIGGWTIGSLPAHYLGFIVFWVGIAGALGLNIFHGGPLDMRLDSEAASRCQKPGDECSPPNSRLYTIHYFPCD